MHDLTSGSISRHLLTTTSFMLVTMIFQTLYFLVDLYWVGRLGKEAVAAVGVAGNLTFVVLAITQMLGVGTTTLVSHAAGRKDRARALLIFNQSQVLAIVVALLFLVIAMALRTRYATLMSADPLTARMAADYLLWYLPAMALQFAVSAMSAALRGAGNFKPSMVVQTATVILNMVLAPFLIFGWQSVPAMGVIGAAISTFIAVGVGTVWLSLYFVKADAMLVFVPADWKPQLRLWSAMLKIGLPAGAEFFLMAVYLFVVYAISRPFGAAAQAGFGIGMRLVQSGFLPVVALGFAVASVAGQNVGAQAADRVRHTFKVAAALAAAAMAGLTVIFQVAPEAMIRFFSDDPLVVAVGREYLLIVSWSFVASGITFVGSSMFQAMGNTMPALITSLVRIVVVTIPAFVLARVPGFELRWIWYLAVVSILLQLATNLLLLRREFRLRLDAVPARAA
ncbi:MAG: MATE family efflux transporter [Acidobacteria bacterium]|nr:MATE family efflux transporter [Acidobacteriota bacterium]